MLVEAGTSAVPTFSSKSVRKGFFNARARSLDCHLAQIVGTAPARIVSRQRQLWDPNRGRPRVPVGRHPGPGGVRKRLGKLSRGLGDYFEDCAASRQSLRSSSYVKTTCSPRSPFSRCPRPDICENRRISAIGSPSNAAARCSPTCSWIFMLIREPIASAVDGSTRLPTFPAS